MVFTTAGGSPPRTSMSHPGTTRGDSTSLDAGAIGCPLSKKGDPSSEEFAKEGLLRGALVWGNKSDWASMVPLRGPAPRPPWLCTVSVREGSLGEMHIYVDPEASWVPVHPCQGSPQTGRKTAGNGTCSGGKQVYLSVAEASPNQLENLRVESPFSRKGGLTWELIVCAIELNSKGGDGRGVATCDGSVDRLGGWCMQLSQCCPYRPVHACRVAVVWSSAEQAILLATRGSWYAAAAEALSRARQAACPLHMAPQPMSEASIDTTKCLDTHPSGVKRKARSDHGLKVWRQDGVTETRYVPLGLGFEASTEAHMKQTKRRGQRLQMPYAPGASETVSVEPPSCPGKIPGSSASTEHVLLKDVLWGWPSPTPYREKRSSAQGRVCSFPSWPEAQGA